MRLLTNCAMLGVLIATSCLPTAPAAAQTPSQSDLWTPDQPNRFEHGWFWDPTDEAWKYGWYQPGNIQPPQREYTLVAAETRSAAAPMPIELRGRILSIEQRGTAYNVPPQVFVIVRTEDGTLRTINVGDAQFVFQNLPDLRENQEVVLRGYLDNVAGRDFFTPGQLVTSRSTLDLPGFAAARRVRGTLVNLYTVPGRGDFEKTLVAQVRTLNGNLVDVVLGPSDQVGNRFYSLQPGTPFVAEGMIEQTPSGTTVYAQNVRIQEQEPREVITATPRTLVMDVEPASPPPAQRLFPPPLPPAQVVTTETVQGRIANLNTAWIGGQARLVADIETNIGNFIRADLGMRATVDYLNLAPGDLITITGRRVFQGGQAVLVADQFAAHGQSIYVQPAPPQVVAAVETTPAPAQSFRGRVVAKRTERTPGFADERIIVDLRLDDGRVVPVDLGLKRYMRGADLDRGDCITIWAHEGTVNGQPGLVAVQVQDNGEQFVVRRCE